MECGVPEFGGRALGEGVWVGFRPSTLEGVSECRGRALGGGVGTGLGLCAVRGRLRGQRIQPESSAGSPVPKWTGKVLATFPSVPPFPPQGLPHPPWTTNHGWILLGVETPPLPQQPLRGAGL